MSRPGNYYNQKRYWVEDHNGSVFSSSIYQSYAQKKADQLNRFKPSGRFQVIDREPKWLFIDE